MSREQRRMDRRSGSRPAAKSATRTPARAGGGVPWQPIAIAAGALALVLLIVYLIIQTTSDDGGLSADQRAEQDASTELPGEFVPSQGRGHFSFRYSPERDPYPYCEGVEDAPQAAVERLLQEDSPTPEADSTPEAGETAEDHDSPSPTGTPPADCYNSLPPSSGQHLNVEVNVDLGNGIIIPRIPPDPNVYPSDVPIPRETIPHILEHAGVFVGYNCGDDDACMETVSQIEDLVNDRIDNHNDRVVMGYFPDLPEGEVGLSSWTRVMRFPHEEYNKDAVEDFIGTHSCRFDPEGFC